MKKLLFIVGIYFLSLGTAYSGEFHRVHIDKSGPRTITIKTGNCINCTAWYTLSSFNEQIENSSVVTERVPLIKVENNSCGEAYALIIQVPPYGIKKLMVNVCSRNDGVEVCSGWVNLSLAKNNCDGKETYFYGSI